MGRSIDRAALTAIGAAGFYLFFLNAGASIPFSCALAFACMAIARFLAKRRPRRDAATAAQAEAALSAVARMPDGEADAALERLARARYPGSKARVAAFLRPPEGTLTADDVFAAWREHRGEAELVVVATCRAAPSAVRCAGALAGPVVRLADAGALLPVIRRTGLFVPPGAPRRSPAGRVRRALAALAARRASPRMLLYGLSLLGMYLLLGRAAYLFAAMGTLFAAGALWIRNGIGKDFENAR